MLPLGVDAAYEMGHEFWRRPASPSRCLFADAAMEPGDLLRCMSPVLADIVAKVPNCPAPIFLL
jgi:hypothetical protein